MFARIAAGSFVLPGLGVMGMLALGACTRTLVLGTDCPDQIRECTQESVNEPVQPGSDDRLDAGEDLNPADATLMVPEDAGIKLRDAGVVPDLHHVPDAASDASLDAIPTFSLLDVANPEFQRNGGLGGDLVLSKLIGTLLPIPPFPLLFAELPSWYACWATSVNSVSRDLVLDGGIATNDYLMFVVNGTPVRQQLSQPLEAGAKYALALSIQSYPDPMERLVLEIRGANEECAVGDLLASTQELPGDAGWSPVCMEFATSRAYKYLLIAPNTIGSMRPSNASRMALDDLRSVPGCMALDAGMSLR
jgi:hypothetical protein